MRSYHTLLKEAIRLDKCPQTIIQQFRKRIENFSNLQKEVDSFFDEYNTERPHYALHGFTPDEIYEGQPLVNNPHQQQIREAMQKRMASNQQNYCQLCSDPVA